MNANLAAVVAATLVVVLAIPRILAALKPATDAFVPSKWAWVVGAVLLSCTTLAAGLPMVTDWLGYSVLLLTVIANFAVAAQTGFYGGKW